MGVKGLTASSDLEGIWMKHLQPNLSGWTEENHENPSSFSYVPWPDMNRLFPYFLCNCMWGIKYRETVLFAILIGVDYNLHLLI